MTIFNFITVFPLYAQIYADILYTRCRHWTQVIETKPIWSRLAKQQQQNAQRVLGFVFEVQSLWRCLHCCLPHVLIVIIVVVVHITVVAAAAIAAVGGSAKLRFPAHSLRKESVKYICIYDYLAEELHKHLQ